MIDFDDMDYVDDYVAPLPELPEGLPGELSVVAATADLIRRDLDMGQDGGKGICLGVSGYLSFLLINEDVDHHLINGVYTDDEGTHPHWWLETPSGWIIDASRGQFTHSDSRRDSVVRRMDKNYRVTQRIDPGHSTWAFVTAELERCFVYPEYAQDALDDFEDYRRRAEREIG